MEEITSRKMMGEYIIYYHGKIIGGIYDDRFLIKDTISARVLMSDIIKERPYDGVKEMLLVRNVEDREYLRKLLEAVYEDLPSAKKK